MRHQVSRTIAARAILGAMLGVAVAGAAWAQSAGPAPWLKAVGAAAAKGGASGPVVASVHVEPSGAVSQVTVLRGDAALSDAVVAALKGWEFERRPEAFDTVAMVNVLPVGGAVFRIPDTTSQTTRANNELMPVRAGGPITAPTKLLDAQPDYPAAALEARAQGIVELELVVGTDGSVHVARAMTGDSRLSAAALAAAGNWVFTQTLLDGRPVPVVMTATVTFALR